MAIRAELPNFDPLARAIPGQSFAETPGLRPYERPPVSSDPKLVLEVLGESLKEERTQEQIVDMLEVGVSAETLSDAFVQKGFMEGMFSPDIAELIKPGVFIVIVQIGTDHNVDDMVLFNEEEQQAGMEEDKKLFLMSKSHPEKFGKLLGSAREDMMGLDGDSTAPDEDTGEEEDIEYNDMMDMEQHEEPGSFLNMMSNSAPTEQEEMEEV